MPTPEENMQSAHTFAEEVFGNKNLQYAIDWLADDFVEHQLFPGTTPDKIGCNRVLSHLLRGISRHDGRDPRHGRG
jgi:hypothetical protein